MSEYDLNLGAKVFCSDGKCGSLAKYAIDPDTRQVTELIVEEGFLLKRARVFPFSSIERVTPTGIHLSLPSGGVEDYPEYREMLSDISLDKPGEAGASSFWHEGMPYGLDPTPPLPLTGEIIRHGVSDELTVVDRSTLVDGQDGSVGKLDDFVVDAQSGEITQIVVQQGLLLATRRAIPASIATTISEAHIVVGATGEALKVLPEYRPERGESQSATGPVDEENDSRARTTAEPDVDLARRVARALFDDPRTDNAVIEVIDEHGVITLDGVVSTAATREASEEIARAVPGITAVVNLLRIER